MDDKQKISKILERVETELNEYVEKEIESKAMRSNHTNPIYRKLATFHNEKIGDKWSIKDLLR